MLKSVKDCSFIYHPDIKRVDFQVVGEIVSTIPDWVSIVKIPDELPIKSASNAYCGTAIVSNGMCGVCYISPSSSGHLAATGISSASAGNLVKLFGSYYTS